MEVSVVMPVYNRCAEMKKALDSLTSQTFKNFELIIIDDGSTDNISETLTMYQNTLNIKYTRVEHTGNLAFLRNLSISMSSGKYIAILDSDDWCHPDRLHIQHKYLENNKDVDVLATWVHIINECEKINSHFLEMLYNMKNDRSDIIIKCLNDGCCICNSTVMIRRNKFNELGGYDEKMIICEDFNLWLRALLKGFKFKILEKKLVFRKIHKNSVTRGYDGSSKAIRLVILNKLYYLLKSSLIYNKTIVIWGKSNRSDVVLDILSTLIDANQSIYVVNVYNQLPQIMPNSYNLVTTYTLRSVVFEYFNKNKLKVVKDYIYI